MPKPPKKPVTDPESAIQKRPDFSTVGSSTAAEKQLRDSVKSFASEIRKTHGLLEPKAAKRLCRDLEHEITRRPRKGRPPEACITQATELFECQRRKNNGCRVNWNGIAQQCIPGYSDFKSLYRRRGELRRLQSAVYARRERQKTNKSPSGHGT